MEKSINHKNYYLYQLLNKFNICIPLIQREYIQGIKNENEELNETINRFIDDIIGALKNNQKISLNIVYGFHTEKTFYPVDGQQRLTLLYLLHWYLAIRAEEFEDFSKLKKFTYETRDSANKFFQHLIGETCIKWEEIFKKSNKVSLVDAIKSQTWFKVQWASDITIISALNILEVLSKKIKKDEAKQYYENLKASNSFICFDVLSEIKDTAKDDANTIYVRLNSRGKQLEEFENAKALLVMIESKMNKNTLEKFTYKYDQKYIDIFYEESNGTLYEKTQQINRKTIMFLKNCYQLWSFVYFEKHKRKQLSSLEEYYSELYKSSRQDVQNLVFFNEYIEFIDIVLGTIYNDKNIAKNLKSMWEKEFFYKDERIKDENYLVAILMYIYFYHKSHEPLEIFAKTDNIEELKYILENLRYTEIEQEKFSFINTMCREFSNEKKVIDYFSKREHSHIISILLKENKVNINDFKVRIQEQAIKAKIISLIKETPEMSNYSEELDCKFFYEIENKSKNKRQIYYLLYISNMWEELIEVEKIKLLLDYIKLVKKYHFKDDLEWRQWFAIATYYDEASVKLKSAETINEEANYVYVRYLDKDKKGYKKLSDENIHFWKEEYYYIYDYESDDNFDDEILNRRFKLDSLKKAYDILKLLDSDVAKKTWLRDKFNNDYNKCWLKYATDRKYIELLTNKISYNVKDKKINIDVDLKNHLGYKIESKRGDFFAYVYSLDKAYNKNEWVVNRQYSPVYDLTSRNVKDTSYIGQFTLYEASKNFLNQFNLNLLWQNEIIVYPYDEGRKFFYYKFSVNFLGDEMTLLSSENEKIKLRYFYNNEYDEFEYDISNLKTKINHEIEVFNGLCSEIENFSIGNSEVNIREENRNKIYDIISKHFDCYKSYTKNYESIQKYYYKIPSKNLEISKEEYKKANGDERNLLEFIGVFSQIGN